MNGTFATDFIHFNSQTNGKDKLCRLFQYGSKFVWWHMQQRGIDCDVIDKLKALENTLSLTRKLLRFGKSFDNLHAACKTVHLNDAILRITVTMSRISQALYLLVDHVLWCGKVGLIKINQSGWNKTSARFWLVSIVLNVCRTVYDLSRAVSREYTIMKSAADFWRRESNDEGFEKLTLYAALKTYVTLYSKALVRLVNNYQPVVLELIRNVCDFPIPMATLGQLNVSPGFLGLFGVISSLIGMLTVWKPVFKLVPA